MKVAYVCWHKKCQRNINLICICESLRLKASFGTFSLLIKIFYTFFLISLIRMRVLILMANILCCLYWMYQNNAQDTQ